MSNKNIQLLAILGTFIFQSTCSERIGNACEVKESILNLLSVPNPFQKKYKSKIDVLEALKKVVMSDRPRLTANVLPSQYTITNVNNTKLFPVLRTPLHWVFEKETLKKLNPGAATKNYKAKQALIASAVEALLLWGANKDSKDFKGNTALHYAMIQENLDAVNHLVNASANPNIQNNQGNTPLLMVVKKVKNIQDEDKKEDPFSYIHPGIDSVVKKFLELKPDLTLTNNAGESVLSILESTEKAKDSSVQQRHETIRSFITDYLTNKEDDVEISDFVIIE